MKWRANKILRIYLPIILVVVFLLSIMIQKIIAPRQYKTVAEDLSQTLTTKADWQEGTNNNTLLDSPDGDIKINLDAYQYDLTTISADNISEGGDETHSGKNNIVDGDSDTYWQFENDVMDTGAYVVLDIGESINIVQFNMYSWCPAMEYDCPVYSSENGVDYTYLGSAGGLLENHTIFTGERTARYIRTTATSLGYEGYSSEARINEYIIYVKSVEAIHTSASDQIYGGENFNEWTSFSASQAVPENTSLSYKFRTSSDALSWTGWSASQTYSGSPIDLSTLVTSESGETKYGYIQVELTLISEDGVATPTLSDYTVNYSTTGLCDDFDHLDISPPSATLESGGSTTITATPEDALGSALPSISVEYSADCGSITEAGVFTAPTVSSTTTCTVSATSDCGGSASSTLTINPVDTGEGDGDEESEDEGVDSGETTPTGGGTEPFLCPFPMTSEDWCDLLDCNPLIIDIYTPKKDDIYYLGDKINISWTMKNSTYVQYAKAYDIRYNLYISLNDGKDYQLIAKSLKDVNFPDQSSYQKFFSTYNINNYKDHLKDNKYEYTILNDTLYVSDEVRVKVETYRVAHHPYACSTYKSKASDKFFIRSKEVDCDDTLVVFYSPTNETYHSSKDHTKSYIYLDDKQIEDWQNQQLDLQIFAAVVERDVYQQAQDKKVTRIEEIPGYLYKIDFSESKIEPSQLGFLDNTGRVNIDYSKYPKQADFSLLVKDPLCLGESVLSIKSAKSQGDISKSLRLLIPNGGEIWFLGTIEKIMWQYYDIEEIVNKIVLELSLDSGKTYEYIIFDQKTSENNPQNKDSTSKRETGLKKNNKTDRQYSQNSLWHKPAIDYSLLSPETVIAKETTSNTDYFWDIPIDDKIITKRARVKISAYDRYNKFIAFDQSDNDFEIKQTSFASFISDLGKYIDFISKLLLTMSALSALLNYLSPFYQLLRGLLLSGKKKKTSFGTLYSATSGEPQSRIPVLLFNASTNRLLKTDITDDNGQFNFILDPGRYYMMIKSERIKIADNLTDIEKKSLYYTDNYFGEVFEIKANENVQSDLNNLNNERSLNADSKNPVQKSEYSDTNSAIYQNLNAKKEDRTITTETRYNIPTLTRAEYSHRFISLINFKNSFLKTLLFLDWPLLIIGTIFSILALFVTIDLINILIIITYVLLWARHFITRPIGKSFGTVLDVFDKHPISLAIVRVLTYHTKKLVESVVTNKFGRYSINLTEGDYLLTVQKYGYINEKPIHIRVSKTNKRIDVTLFVKREREKTITQTPKENKIMRSAGSLSEILDGYSGDIGQ